MTQTAVRRVVREIPAASVFNIGDYTAPKLVVAAYARVSTEKEEQEESFERQVEHYTTLINSKSEWVFGGIYADPGITGTRAEKRPDFMRMISDCRAGKINKILVKSISRFARNTVDVLQNDAQRTPQVRLFDFIDIDTVVADFAVGDIVKAVDKIGDGRFAGAGCPDKSHFLPRFGIKGDVVQDRLVLLVAEIDVVKAHRSS